MKKSSKKKLIWFSLIILFVIVSSFFVYKYFIKNNSKEDYVCEPFTIFVSCNQENNQCTTSAPEIREEYNPKFWMVYNCAENNCNILVGEHILKDTRCVKKIGFSNAYECGC